MNYKVVNISLTKEVDEMIKKLAPLFDYRYPVGQRRSHVIQEAVKRLFAEKLSTEKDLRK